MSLGFLAIGLFGIGIAAKVALETMGSIGPNLTEEMDEIEQNLDADMG